MSNYRELKGYNVKSVSSDPSNLKLGQIWYNSTLGSIKVAPKLDSWAAGGSLNTARGYLSAASAGTQNATLGFGGNAPPAAQMNNSESYNGSTWTATPTLNAGRRMLGGAGTQTAALAFGGFRDSPAGPPFTGKGTVTEDFDGSSWTTAPATMGTGVNLFASFGTNTAAVAATGTEGTQTQLYNGSAWTTSPASVNTGRFDLAGAGTQTAGVIFGGLTPPSGPPYTASSATEEWSGSSWTTGGALNTARRGPGGAGTQTAALAAGGGPPYVNATEVYDGTSWTNKTSLTTTRGSTAGAGAQAAGLIFGGHKPAAANETEEFTFDATPRTVDVS